MHSTAIRVPCSGSVTRWGRPAARQSASVATRIASGYHRRFAGEHKVALQNNQLGDVVARNEIVLDPEQFVKGPLRSDRHFVIQRRIEDGLHQRIRQ